MQEQIEEMYRHYYGDLYRFLRRYGLDSHIIDDLIQNTFIEVLRSIERYAGQSSLKTWLFAIAKHQMYRHFRKHRETFEELSENEPATEHDFTHKLLADQIQSAIETLEPPHRDIMRLRLVYGFPFRDIAQRVGRTENYCRVSFYRIKEKLRKEFEP